MVLRNTILLTWYGIAGLKRGPQFDPHYASESHQSLGRANVSFFFHLKFNIFRIFFTIFLSTVWSFQNIFDKFLSTVSSFQNIFDKLLSTVSSFQNIFDKFVSTVSSFQNIFDKFVSTVSSFRNIFDKFLSTVSSFQNIFDKFVSTVWSFLVLYMSTRYKLHVTILCSTNIDMVDFIPYEP